MAQIVEIGILLHKPLTYYDELLTSKDTHSRAQWFWIQYFRIANGY